jgi:hypothetical protein
MTPARALQEQLWLRSGARDASMREKHSKSNRSYLLQHRNTLARLQRIA